MGTSIVKVTDPHALVINDGVFAGAWVAEQQALELLGIHAEWQMPFERPAFAQGEVAGIAAKLYFKGGKVLIIVPAPYAHELEERLV